MTLATIILSLFTLILFVINANSNKKHIEGIRVGFQQMWMSLPLILLAFILAGMIEVLIPVEFVKRFLSTEAGLRGVFLGTLGGMLLGVGPYAAFPIIGSIMVSGAGLGTVVSLLTGWCILGLSKAPFESAFFGFKFFVYKTLFSIPFCLVAGLIAHFIELTFL